MQELERVQKLQDGALIERLTHSVMCDRRLTVRLLAEMGEVAERGLFRDQGFSTMFEYATRKLGMSEAEAALRIRAAKLGRMFPIALEMLGRNELHLTTLSLLAPVLTEDKLELLYEARFKSKQQVLELRARHAPKPDVPDSVRQLPAPRPSARAKQPQRPQSAVVPLSVSQDSAGETSRHKVTFTASQRVRDLIEEARDLFRHRQPDGELEPLFEQALELLVAQEKRRRFALTQKPRARAKSSVTSRDVPADVRRDVCTRDRAQCRFVAPDGTRCCARSRLEFHHVHAYGRGGVTSAENIVLMCHAHNALLAEREYGAAFIRARRAGSSKVCVEVDPMSGRSATGKTPTTRRLFSNSPKRRPMNQELAVIAQLPAADVRKEARAPSVNSGQT